MQDFFKRLLQAPRTLDVLILSLFAVVITFQPFYLQGQINIYEVGLYLPGINALLHGLVPFRDFFHLRGPFELYMPAFLMSAFGENIAVLSAYFYAGTILTLIFCIFLAKELYRSRLFLYLFAFVFIARTFPRVVFTYWGGIRYGFGILALLWVIKFFKTEQLKWMFWAGLTTAVGFFTSIEIGVCLGVGILVSLAVSWFLKIQPARKVLRGFLFCAAGFAAVAIPYFLYLALTGSLLPYLESLYAVVVQKDIVIDPHIVSPIPSNPFEAVKAMLIPVGKNFRHMTPSYFYIILIYYFWKRARGRAFDKIDLGVAAIAAYGLIMYNTAFRNIWAAQFEMALQPEKILLFFILEKIYFDLKGFVSLKKWKARQVSIALSVFLFFVALSSVGYAMQRYAHRFYAFKYVIYTLSGKDTAALKPYADMKLRPLNTPRGKGMVVPVEQADEIEAVVNFLEEHTKPDEAVLMYPELGTYNFFADRPFIGRFPISTFSWFNENWHRELVADFKRVRPHYVVVIREFPVNWKEVYLAQPENVRKYNEMMDMIRSDYKLKTTTPKSFIYELKNRT